MRSACVQRALSWVALPVACALPGCGRVSFELLDRGDSSVDAAEALPSFGVPRPVEGLSSVGSLDDPTLTGDRLELHADRDGDIWRATRTSTSEPWTDAAPVPELNSPEVESSPEISPDGLTLWFVRRENGGDYDVFMSRRPSRDAPWDTPTPVPELTTTGNESNPTPSADLLWMTFERTETVHLATRGAVTDPWTELGPIEAIASDHNDGGAMLTRGATVLYFDSERPAAESRSNIWLTERADLSSPFGPPRLVPELSSPDDDGDPWLSEDSRYVIFQRGRVLYEAQR